VTICFGHTDGGHCRLCKPELYEPRSMPTVAPPPSDEIANDLIARARRLEKLSQQLAREANDLHYAAARIRKELER
jgi:hypothetical protein